MRSKSSLKGRSRTWKFRKYAGLKPPNHKRAGQKTCLISGTPHSSRGKTVHHRRVRVRPPRGVVKCRGRPCNPWSALADPLLKLEDAAVEIRFPRSASDQVVIDN